MSDSVGSGQSAACWVVVTPNGRHAYVTNTASGNISAYAVGRNGQVALGHAIAATTDAGPIDAAVTPRGRTLFVRNGGGRSIQSFGIGGDGQRRRRAAPRACPPVPTGWLRTERCCARWV